MRTKKGLAKSTVIVGSGIMASRLLGFVRDVLMAKFFGIGIAAQAFVIAFTLPNSLRNLVAEGAVNTALVPVLTEYHTKRSKAEFWHFANALFNLFLIILLLITVLGVLAAPLLARIIAPGFIEEPAKLSLTITLLKMMFPYILLVGLAAYCTGVLHTFRHFAIPAFSTALFNVVLICGILAFYPNVSITYLAYAVIIGGILQVAIQFPLLLKRGPFFSWKAGLINEGTKRVGKLFLPRIVGAGVYEINVVIDRMLASLQFIVGEGAVAALYYGNRLFQLPLALFGLAVATAALPTMSSQAVENNIEKLKETISFSLKNMFFFCMPAAIALMVLSRPIIKVLFERDEFTMYATEITSGVLFFYAIGLVAYGGVNILVAAFHSMQDTVTPVKVASLALISNIILNLVLIFPLKASGLALATSISGFINVSALSLILKRKIGQFIGKEVPAFFMKVLIASLVMGIIAYIMMIWLPWGKLIRNCLNLMIIVVLSLLTYFFMSSVLKTRDIRVLLTWIRKD